MKITDEIIKQAVEKSLWHEKSAEGITEKNHLIEQYKIYVEMADRISQRRGTANTFFLAFNTALVGALAELFEEMTIEVSIAMYVASVILSIAWGLILRSYRNLNTAKFIVISELEKRLPAQPYYEAEWKALGEGKDFRRYISLSRIELLVPIAFIGIYVYLFIIAVT